MQPTCQCFLLKYCVATRVIVGLKCTEGHQLALRSADILGMLAERYAQLSNL